MDRPVGDALLIAFYKLAQGAAKDLKAQLVKAKIRVTLDEREGRVAVQRRADMLRRPGVTVTLTVNGHEVGKTSIDCPPDSTYGMRSRRNTCSKMRA